MHKWDHGSGAQQQRRPQLGLLVSRRVKLGLGLGLELGSGLGLRLQGATNYVLRTLLPTTYSTTYYVLPTDSPYTHLEGSHVLTRR